MTATSIDRFANDLQLAPEVRVHISELLHELWAAAERGEVALRYRRCALAAMDAALRPCEPGESRLEPALDKLCVVPSIAADWQHRHGCTEAAVLH